MGEDTIPFFENEIKDTMQGIIKVVGVGGGGCNAVRNMYCLQYGQSVAERLACASEAPDG